VVFYRKISRDALRFFVVGRTRMARNDEEGVTTV
jgi:hypothetical protein